MIYDTVIIGSGPAGLSAAIYACRAQMSVVVAEKEPFGAGQISESEQVENYPGLYGEKGYALGERLRLHAKTLGAPFSAGEVVEVKKEGGVFLSVFSNGSILESKTVIYAAGASHRKLNVPGEETFRGKGISTCATCDGALYREKTVAVIGGGDTALGEALFLEKIAKTVYLIHRRAQFRANPTLRDRVRSSGKIKTVTEAVVTEILGDARVSDLRIERKGKAELLPVDGIFPAIGMIPNTAAVKPIATLDGSGYLIADETGVTSAEGLFAAGDVRTKRLRQVVTAASDGANCVASAAEYLEKQALPIS